MLLAELFLLCTLDPLRGTVLPNRSVAHQPRFLATALIIELAICRELKRFEDGMHLDHDLPSFHILVDRVREAIKRANKGFTPDQAIELTLHELPNLREDLLDGLAERGVLHTGRRRYWLFGERPYPLRSRQAAAEAIELLRAGASGADRSLRSMAAAALATGSGLATILLPAEQSNHLHIWMRELARAQQQPIDPEQQGDAEASAVMIALSHALSG
ncbi:MAG: GPP34 family phosphoprotein [Xanthomonadales bacterium]|nr:GPP34 family phosphoprotein [Xanthomonadales bacterium]